MAFKMKKYSLLFLLRKNLSKISFRRVKDISGKKPFIIRALSYQHFRSCSCKTSDNFWHWFIGYRRGYNL